MLKRSRRHWWNSTKESRSWKLAKQRRYSWRKVSRSVCVTDRFCDTSDGRKGVQQFDVQVELYWSSHHNIVVQEIRLSNWEDFLKGGAKEGMLLDHEQISLCMMYFVLLWYQVQPWSVRLTSNQSQFPWAMEQKPDFKFSNITKRTLENARIAAEIKSNKSHKSRRWQSVYM